MTVSSRNIWVWQESNKRTSEIMWL